MAKSLGAALRAARERAGMTQAEVGRRVGLAPNHVARLENGEKLEPRFVTVARLAAALGLSLDDLAADLGLRAATPLAPSDTSVVLKVSSELRQLAKALEASAAQVRAGIDALEEATSPKGRRGRR